MTGNSIEKKIVGFAVKKANETPAVEPTQETVEQLHEGMKRPEFLHGSTYKIKAPNLEHSIYVTINDVVLNEGTENEERRPFELFINSKNMDNFQWVTALTRVISAVFRKGGEYKFLVKELQATFDPHGGYYKGGGKFSPSLVADIGDVIQKHLERIGAEQKQELSATQVEILAKKKAEYLEQTEEQATETGFPASATLCTKCNVKAGILMDGCYTCLNCGDSKCG